MTKLTPEQAQQNGDNVMASEEFQIVTADLLTGPDGFECDLGEPEDRIWYRDLVPVVDKLNQLHSARKAAFKEAAKLVALMFSHHITWIDGQGTAVEHHPIEIHLPGGQSVWDGGANCPKCACEKVAARIRELE